MKHLATSKLSGGFLNKAKTILSKEQALDWKTDDRIEDRYKDSLIPKKNQSPARKVYESDYPPASKPSFPRLTLQSPFKGKILRKTYGSINGNLFFKHLNQKIINASKSTVELSNGKIIRKSDNAISKSKSFFLRYLKENISFLSFPISDFQVDSRKISKHKPSQARKIGPKTRQLTDSATSDNNTRTRVSNHSNKATKNRPTRNKASTSNAGYLAGDESMFIPSDISNISDWNGSRVVFPAGL